jgi:hypothetical protein
MPHSFTHLDAVIADRIGLDFQREARILDVGAGAAKYRDLLIVCPNIDAVEAHEPYVSKFCLRERYGQVHVADVLDLPGSFFADYDLVILGDVLEHLSVPDAQTLLASIAENGPRTAVLVAVPFLFEQDAADGVEWEIHKQPELTHELFCERYPDFDCLVRDEQQGIYVRDPLGRWEIPKWPERDYVMIAVPTYRRVCHADLAGSLWGTLEHHMRHGLAQLDLKVLDGTDIVANRNILIDRFFEEPRYTHLLFIDSDQGFPNGAVGRLLSHRAHFIGVPIKLRRPEIKWNIARLPPYDAFFWNGRALGIGSIGAGMIMMSRRCIERMLDVYPKRFLGEDGKQHCQLFVSDGDKSEDIGFCNRWTDIGGRIWADPAIEVAHVGVAEWRGRFLDTMTKLAAEASDETNLRAAE